MKSNTYVFGAGGIKCLAEHGAGGFILIKNAIQNVVWVGPSVDINEYVNMNGFAIGDVPNTTDFVSDIYIEAKVVRTRIDRELEAVNTYFENDPVLFAGGGKGFTVQFRARNVYINGETEDCDIACSVEAAVSDTRYLDNVVVDLWAKDSHRCALFIGGSRDTISSLASGSFMHSRYPGVKLRVRAQGGQDDLMYSPDTGEIDGPNWSNSAVVAMNYASGIDLELYAATEERCTLVRGMASASTIRITNALMDELEDVWDTRPIDTLDPAGIYMADNVFEANVHADTHHGVVVRANRNSGFSSMVKTSLDISMWCQNGVGAITQNDGATDEFGTSVAYRFRDMRSNPLKEVVGHSGVNSKPQWSLASNGGGVVVRREAWHDGTREVATFDTTNGWSFPNIHYDEKPLVFGTGGSIRRYLHYDTTNQVLRLAGTPPAREGAGAAIAAISSSTLPDGAATASVRNQSILVTANTSATTITNLTDAISGQVVTIRFNDNYTTVQHGTIRLRNGVDAKFATNDTLTLISSAGGWYEIGRKAAALTGTATLDFGSIDAQDHADLTITVTGAVTGDAVALGIPTAAVTNGVAYTAWVSATNTVTVRAHNYGAAAADPASGTFRATIVR